MPTQPKPNRKSPLANAAPHIASAPPPAALVCFSATGLKPGFGFTTPLLGLLLGAEDGQVVGLLSLALAIPVVNDCMEYKVKPILRPALAPLINSF